MPLFKEHIQYAQRLMDDLVDLEIEKIDKIIEKVLSDPETEDVKRVELELWKKIRAQTLKGRRTGLGITAEGDMLAALNIQYASDYAIAFSTEVHKQLALSAYESSVTMAKERGAFPVYQAVNEANNPFVLRLKQADPKLYEDMVRYGRRNIALLTIAPTGSVSICTQTTSGIEPAFNIVYNRRRKVNPNDNNIKKFIRDTTGDYFEEYRIFHPKFITWAKKHNYTKEQLENLSEEALNKLIENSPYYKSTAADTNYVKKVELQGSIQKWVDHSISVTINLPSTVTKETVNELYLKAWEVGCKGLTVYREGSREGILQTAQNKTNAAEDKPVLKRPKELKADVIRFKNNNEDWVAFVGVLNGKPYEIFTGKTEEDRFPIPKWVERGNIIQTVNENNVKSYDFQYFDKDGYEVIMRGLSRCFNPDFWNYAKMISGLLRHHIPLDSIINIVSGLNFNEASINSWRNGVIRAIKKFIQDGSKPAEMRCPNCEQESMEIKEGCAVCTNCGFSKCGG
jgi:ribonucleoside-diphosphate reductase alpha chain